MARPFSMGVTLHEWMPQAISAYHYTDLQLLGYLDAFKNLLADQLGVARNSAAGMQLYPESCTISVDIRDNTINNPAPRGGAFPSDTLMDGLRDRGCVPLFFINPAGIPSATTQGWCQWENWSAGMFNDWIDQFSADGFAWVHNGHGNGLNLKGDPKDSQILLRLGAEQNGLLPPGVNAPDGLQTPWLAWGVGTHYRDTGTPPSHVWTLHYTITQAQWIAGFKYIHDRFRITNGATFFRLFYAPTGFSGNIENQYPGDDACEYAGFQMYAKRTTDSTHPAPGILQTTMRAAYQESYDHIKNVAPNKKLIIGETGVTADATDANRANYFLGAGWADGGGYPDIVTGMGAIRGVTYFNVAADAPIFGEPEGWQIYHPGGGYATAHAYAQMAKELSVPYSRTFSGITFSDALDGIVKVHGATSEHVGLLTASDSLPGTVRLTGSIADSQGSNSDTLRGTVRLTGSITADLASYRDTLAGIVKGMGMVIEGDGSGEGQVLTDVLPGSVRLTGSVTERISGYKDTLAGTSKFHGAITDSAGYSDALAGSAGLHGSITDSAQTSQQDTLVGHVHVHGVATSDLASYNDSLAGTVRITGAMTDDVTHVTIEDEIDGTVKVKGSVITNGLENVPDGPVIYGVDVAFTSGRAKIAKAIIHDRQFAITKATQDDWEDDGFKENLAAIKASEMVPGSFHFLVNSVKIKGVAQTDPSISAAAQATYYLARVEARNGSLENHLFALDLENFERSHTNAKGKRVLTYRSVPTLENVDDWIATFRAALPEAFLLLYTNPSKWKALGNKKIKDRYGPLVRLWLADWVRSPDFTLHLGGLRPAIHQYGLDKEIVKLNVDGDATRYTVAELRGLANWNTDDGEEPPGDGTEGDNQIGCPDEIGNGAGDPPPETAVVSVEDGIYDSGSHTVGFDVVVSPVNQDAAVEVDLVTVNGTAKAGTNYTTLSAHVTIAAGDGSAHQTVAVLTPSGATGDKTFSVKLSTPVNAVLGDAMGSMEIEYSGGGGGTRPEDLEHYEGWPSTDVVYNEFADMTHRNECTAYAAAAVASAHYYRAHDGKSKVFNAHRLFVQAGGSPCPEAQNHCLDNGHCCGFYDGTVLEYLKKHGIATQSGHGAVRKIRDYKQLSADSVDALVVKIKKAIHSTGVVYASGIFYDNWNSAGSRSWPHQILPDNHGDRATTGHSWVLTGWKNDIGGSGIGGFHVQSSHGENWSEVGRAWLPYDYIVRRSKRDADNSVPWFRFWKITPEEG